jgi:hypothetical protein
MDLHYNTLFGKERACSPEWQVASSSREYSPITRQCKPRAGSTKPRCGSPDRTPQMATGSTLCIEGLLLGHPPPIPKSSIGFMFLG